MIGECLREIGLSKNETKIYLALLELGPSLMGQICGKTKIHRRNVYDSMEMLKDKGFVSSTTVNNRNVFEAVDPKRILDILEEKKTNIQAILPELLVRQSTKKQSVKIYSGLMGRKVIFEDKLKHKEEQYILGAHQPAKRMSPYLKNYHKRRIAEKIPLKMLYVKDAKGTAKEFSKLKYIEARLLPSKFESATAINIYGNKVALLLGSKKSEPTTLLIEVADLADDFRIYFKTLWKISKPV